jgi:hypothetical protein
VWILIEYRGLWAHDAVDGSTLSKEVKAHLRAERSRLAHARILFVRRAERRGRDGLLAFVAHTTQSEGTVRRLELERHDDLIGLELDAAGSPVDHPLFLVCTHGKHDRCCAKYGRPLYDAVCEQVEDGWAWQSTHIGGDRFAGNLLCLSRGVYYGRVEREDAGRVLDAHLEDTIELAHYRGRSCYSFAAQAVERDIRERTGLLRLDELRLVSEQGSRIAFADREGHVHEREVSLELGPKGFLTCTATELHRPRRYVVNG